MDMEITKINHLDPVYLKKKPSKDEKIVRKTLVRVWIQVLEKYARPGAVIPSERDVRKELLRVGVDASVNALKKEHWYAFDWMFEDKVRRGIEKELDAFDLVGFLEGVKEAQTDPNQLERSRETIRTYLLTGI
jgi:hypothetical protein